jgi:phage anti-repressor protein
LICYKTICISIQFLPFAKDVIIFCIYKYIGVLILTNEFEIEIIKQKFGDSEENSVSARELHKLLEVKDKFPTWFKRRVEKYGFEENIDYFCISQNRETQRENGQKGVAIFNECFVTIDMANELAMVENSAIGKEVRRYFIRIENKFRNEILKVESIKNLENLNEISKNLDDYFAVFNGAVKFIEVLNDKNDLELFQIDKFMKEVTGVSTLELFGIDFKNGYFIPTELGKIVGKSAVEINLILEKNGFQEKVDGVWKQLNKFTTIAIKLV